MSWYYLDTEGTTQGPVSSMFILSTYHMRDGITANTHIWNVERGVKDWSELLNVYSFVIDDTINSIISGMVTKNILSLIMNPYHIYICKKKEFPNSPLPIGKATLTIDYKGYLANTVIDNTNNNTLPLQHFIQNRESIQLGMKKNAYGLEMALYKIREGEECLIYIPWRLAYGEKGITNLIPSKTDILFTLSVHQIQEQGQKWQQKQKFEKWSKMKAKWNNQKQMNNMLYIKDEYDENEKPKPKPKQKQLELEEQKEEQKQDTIITANFNNKNYINKSYSQPLPQPPPAGSINSNIIDNNILKKWLAWDKWLLSQQIPESLIDKLRNGGIASWDELHAMEDDVDITAVAKELGITAIQKIKLKAILRKLPPINDLPQMIIEQEKEEEKEEEDLDDPKYLKSQILLLKEENDRLNKLSDENGSKQQLMESWDNLFTKDMEIKQLIKKYENKRIECMKLEKLIQVKNNQNYIDIQQKIYDNYNELINTLINEIETSKSSLDNIAMDAINNTKNQMNKNGNILNNQLENKKRILEENQKNVKELKKHKIKLIENNENKNNICDKYDDILLRIDNVDQLTKKRQSIKIKLNTKINLFLSSINNEKTIILSKISQLCSNKYNNLFYKYFIEEMSMNFYDCKLIYSQFVLNYNNLILPSNNDSVLCKDGEKIIFDIALTKKLLSIIRNKHSKMNMIFDILCLDKFINNMIEFENNIIYNDPLTFASIIGINLTNSKQIQNLIKSIQKTSLYNNNEVDDKIAKNLRKNAKLFVDNLTICIVTGYAMLIINACNDKMDYIQCLTDLCLSHPNMNSPNLNKENLNKILKNIQTKELSILVQDYFDGFGSLVFMERIINNAKSIKSLS